jgi:type VI protein secretion system component Hcp
MLKTLKAAGAVALSSLIAGCMGPPSGGAGNGDLVGTAVLALTGVPTDGTCIQVAAAGYRTVTRSFNADPGSNAMLTMSGLPLGQVTFSAQAFAGGCPAAADAVPTWVSDASFTATVAVKPPVLVTLNLVRNGNATVAIGFDDGDTGAAGSGGSGGAAGSSAGGSGMAGSTGTAGSGGTTSAASGEFMKVPNVNGGSTAKGFENWFVLEGFTLGLNTAVGSATSGQGSGVGKTTWTAAATLRYQQGVPQLYGDAVQGTHLSEVDVAIEKGGSMPVVSWRATLKNVIISSVEQGQVAEGDALPLLKVTLSFAQVLIEFDPINPDGSSGDPIQITWDIAKAEGGGPPNPPPPLDFAYRGAPAPGFEAISAFRAPSEATTSSAATGTGAGAGKAEFTDASATLPIDASVLTMILEEAAGSVLPSSMVQILGTDDRGVPAVLGTYGFEDVVIDAITLTDLSATVSWQAASFSWTFGSDTTTFP